MYTFFFSVPSSSLPVSKNRRINYQSGSHISNIYFARIESRRGEIEEKYTDLYIYSFIKYHNSSSLCQIMNMEKWLMEFILQKKLFLFIVSHCKGSSNNWIVSTTISVFI